MNKTSNMFSRLALLPLLFTLLTGLTGCQSTPSATGASGETGAIGTNAQPQNAYNPEVLQSGDTLYITFYDVPQQAMPVEVQIRPDGTIPLMEGKVFQAAGMTRSELEKEIQKVYVPAYYPRMTPVIKPKEDTRLYYVGGEVRQPGGQFYRARTTVIKAIQSAGDFTDFANKRRVELTRSGAKKPVIINATKARRNPELDLEVYPGDRIHVPRRILW
jgi:protein involved in polysaccharide export with SLBB domain